MSLVKCIECNKEFSDKVSACPNCSCPTTYSLNNDKDKKITAETQKNINIILNRLSKDLEKENNFFSKEIEDISNYVSNEIKNIKVILEKYRQEELNKIKKEYFDRKTDLNNKKNILKAETEKYIEQLFELSFLHFIKESELEKKIEINETNIRNYDKELEEIDNNYNNEINKLKLKYEQKLEDQIQKIKDMIVYPTSPNKIIEYVRAILNAKNTFYPITNSEDKAFGEKIIIALDEIDKPVTVTEIQELNSELASCSNQKISMFLKRLVNNNKVFCETKNLKNYYSVNKIENIKLKDDNFDIDFSKERSNIFYQLNKYEKNDDIVQHLLKTNKELTELRIYQILYSLKEDGIELVYIDNKIKFMWYK